MKKEKIVARLHRRINKASRKIDTIALQTHLAKAEAKAAFDKRIKGLENQKNKFRDEIHHLQHITTNAWEDLAEGCNNSWLELKTALKKTAAEFRS